MNFNVTFTKEELPDLRKLLDRAMNTWGPLDQPAWLQGLSDRVDRALAGPASALLTSSLPYPFDLQNLVLNQIQAQNNLLRGGVL